MNEKIILSMTTIPSRKTKFLITLNYIINNVLDLVDEFYIVLQTGWTDEDYKFYSLLNGLNQKIKFITGDSKWRSCNKLLPTLKIADETIITIDDDILYKKQWFVDMLERHKKYPDSIIALESNPIKIEENLLKCLNATTLKINQLDYSKYLSGCCLFPKGTFYNTQLFNYELMYEMTNGVHDELWFWINSTLIKDTPITVNILNNIFASGLEKNYETFFKNTTEGENNLSKINSDTEVLKTYNDKINEKYKNEIKKIFEQSIQINIDTTNVQYIFLLLEYINDYYKDFKEINLKCNVETSWKILLYNTIKKNEMNKIHII